MYHLHAVPHIRSSLSQEANVVIAVGSNDEVYPIGRHDLEATPMESQALGLRLWEILGAMLTWVMLKSPSLQGNLGRPPI